MTLIESSAWIEFLRDTGSPACSRVRQLLVSGSRDVAICDAVRMEILAGANDDLQRKRVLSLWDEVTLLTIESSDYDRAAELYLRCRRGGETVRNLIDCLIAAVAIRSGIPVLHNDRDFDVLARHTELQADLAAR